MRGDRERFPIGGGLRLDRCNKMVEADEHG